MKLQEINPFIRYAQHHTVASGTPVTVSLDCRLFYVLKTQGEARLQIHDQLYDLCEDSIFLWKSGTPYRFLIDGPVLLITINFDYVYRLESPTTSLAPILVSEFREENLIEDIHFEDADDLNKPIILYGAGSFLPKTNQLIKEQQEQLSYYQESCSALMKTMIMEILRRNLFVSDKIPHKIKLTIQFIQENYQKKLTNEMIADHAGYHPLYLNRLMKLYTNHSLHEYVTNFRIEKSKEMLLNTALPIADIADACGFYSPYHFTDSFKKATTSSPKAFRRMYL